MPNRSLGRQFEGVVDLRLEEDRRVALRQRQRLSDCLRNVEKSRWGHRSNIFSHRDGDIS